MWTAGDYPEVARRIESVAELLVERVGAGAGVSLLDVATGSGNVALAAARAGAVVTGLDLTPKLLEAARGRALEAGLEIELIEGDAEALPFADECFDLVTSCFGVIFAPRQRIAAGELVRVARPGATIAVDRLDARRLRRTDLQHVRALHAPAAAGLRAAGRLGRGGSRGASCSRAPASS